MEWVGCRRFSFGRTLCRISQALEPPEKREPAPALQNAPGNFSMPRGNHHSITSKSTVRSGA
jgi:hypothetical protein